MSNNEGDSGALQPEREEQAAERGLREREVAVKEGELALRRKDHGRLGETRAQL